MTTNREKINSKKVRAFDLLRRMYGSVAETKRLQREITALENEIVKLEKADSLPVEETDT